jgi:hypothetical protein
MKGWIGVTDNDWFDFLSQQPGIDEVNFCFAMLLKRDYVQQLRIEDPGAW